MSLAFALILGHAVPAFAEPARPNCATLPARVCEFYRAHAEDRFIELPDGAFSRNPLYRPADPEFTASTPDISFTDEVTLGDLMDILDVPALSTRAKLNLSMNVEEFFSAGSESVSLPWPLKSPRPGAKFMPQAEAFANLEHALGRERFARLRSFVTQTQTKISVAAQKQLLAAAGADVVARREKLARLAADPARLAAREAHVLEIFTRAKASLVQIIAAGRPPERLSDEQKNLLRRIEGLHALVLDAAAGEAHPVCKNLALNAFHDREYYDVELCPGLIWEPDAKLAFVFGHELAHALDPCAIENDVVRIDQAKLDGVVAAGVLPTAVAAHLIEFKAEAHAYFSPIDAQYVDDAATRRQLERAGALSVLVPRLNELPELYKSVYSCVARRYEYRAPTSAQREDALGRAHQNLSDFSGLPPSQRAEFEARLRRYLEAHPNCPVMDADSQSQMNEVIADVFGALVKEKFTRDHPPRGETEKMLSLFNGPNACAVDQHFNAPDANPVDVVKYLNAIKPRADDAHPAAVKRLVQEVDLPGLAAAAGCVRDETGCFDHLSLIKAGATAEPTGAEK